MKKVNSMTRQSKNSEESIEMDEYSDEDDEVFLRNSQNNESSVKKPLMKKTKKKQNGDFHAASIRTSNPKYRTCCGPLCMMFLGFKTLLGVLIITIILVNYFTHTGWYLWHRKMETSISHYAPCHDLKVFPIWQKNFPKFLSEGSLRLLNVSQDEVLDVLVPFGTGSDGYDVPDIVCDIYFDGKRPCLGGVMALDGRNGETLWIRFTEHEVFALTCQGDLNQDGVTDCLAGGRAGLFLALSGKDGEVLWAFNNELIQSDLMSVYAAQFVHDLNGDQIPEVLAVHGGDELSDPALERKMFGRIILFSGKDGSILQWMQTPDRKESYYPPQILTKSDGEQLVLFGTGGNTKSGSLYIISLYDLYKRDIDKAHPIYHDDYKGMLTPAALADINRDGVEDIVIATFNSHVIAFDGLTYQQVWNVTFAGGESYGSIAVGMFNEDDIPDFLVKYQIGRGYPSYEYEKTVVLSGLNGSKLSEEIIDSIGSQSSPLSVSMAGKGNDMFLHWLSNCRGHEKERLKFSFPEGTSIHQQSRTDLCQSLFDEIQVSQFIAFSREHSNHSTIYDSQVWADFEHTGVINTSNLAASYLRQNPAYQKEAQRIREDPGQYSVFPYLRNDFEDKLALLERELAKSEGTKRDEGSDILAYHEGESDPVHLTPTSKGKKIHSAEIIPQMVYAQPHQVKKLPKELDDSVVDNFESPYRKRVKRLASPLHWGIHRLMATGTLAPAVLKSDDSIDLILSSHWIYPTQTPVLQSIDEECIRNELKGKKTYLNEEDMEEYSDKVVIKCLKASGHLPRQDKVYESASDYNPYSINMGQLTIYRFTLRCVCNEKLLSYGQECAKVLPYHKQRWPAFMGLNGDARFLPN